TTAKPTADAVRAALNPQQQDVVNWVIRDSGSLIVRARAGCGKTVTVVQGIVRAIVENNLGEIALMAYNKAAAEEFKSRLQRMADCTGDVRFTSWKNVDTGTVHSFGFRAVRKWAPGVKVDDK